MAQKKSRREHLNPSCVTRGYLADSNRAGQVPAHISKVRRLKYVKIHISSHTGGDDVDDAVVMAEDVLALTLSTLEDNGGTVPTISPVARHLNENQSIKLIACDTDDYRKRLAANR